MSFPRLPNNRFWSGIVTGLLIACPSLLNAVSSHAAQTLGIRYGPFERAVQVSDLRRYAEVQQATPELASLLQYLDPDARKGLQPLLQAEYPVNVAVLDQVLDSKVGQAFLAQVSGVFAQPNPGGIPALRSALILGSAPPGLSLLSIIEAYPSPRVTVDVPKVIALIQEAMPDPPRDRLASIPMWETVVEYQAMMGTNRTYAGCLFGDSISSALGSDLGEGRINLALGGMSTISLQVQIERLIQQQVKCQTTVIAIGTNDAMYGLTDEQFQQNLASIISITRNGLGAQNIILIPAFYSTVKASHNPHMAGTLTRVDEINAILRGVAKAENVPVQSDIAKPFFEKGALKESLTFDGVHLNAEGIKLYRQAILNLFSAYKVSSSKTN
ncbi:MAG: alpha/beta hydrolase [Thermosynechococcaceae cyanobacterium]